MNVTAKVPVPVRDTVDELTAPVWKAGVPDGVRMVARIRTVLSDDHEAVVPLVDSRRPALPRTSRRTPSPGRASRSINLRKWVCAESVIWIIRLF